MFTSLILFDRQQKCWEFTGTAVWLCPEDRISLWACLLHSFCCNSEHCEPSDVDVLFVVDIYSVPFDQHELLSVAQGNFSEKD